MITDVLLLFIVTSAYYLLALLAALSGILFADYHLKLVLFRSMRTTFKLIVVSTGFFLVWDILGIALNVFATNQKWVTGPHILTPNLPLEEVLFLAFFSYTTLIVWRLVCLRTS